jgi:hypothetical protein
MTKPTESLKNYWRSLEDHDGTHVSRRPTSSPASRQTDAIPR